MATVAVGARLVLRTERGPVGLRSVAAVPLQDHWSIPVLAPAGEPLDGLAGELEVPTDSGVLRLRAHLVSDGAVLSVQPGLGVPLQIQRRDDVRAEVLLPVRVVPQPVLGLAAADELLGGAVDGLTVSVSAGGLGIRLERPLPAGRLYTEVQLPDGRLVPAVLAVLDAGPNLLRARFDRIEPADRERLVRLVFEQQRRELAARKRLREVWPASSS